MSRWLSGCYHTHTDKRTCMHAYIYMQSCRSCLCVCVFRISEKRADRFQWNFSRFIAVIGKRERIKTFGKFRPLMCKNSENSAKLPISINSPWTAHVGLWYDSSTSQSCAGLGVWPVAFDGGPYQMHLCSWVQFSSPNSWPAFGRVNASVCIHTYIHIK